MTVLYLKHVLYPYLRTKNPANNEIGFINGAINVKDLCIKVSCKSGFLHINYVSTSVKPKSVFSSDVNSQFGIYIFVQ